MGGPEGGPGASADVVVPAPPQPTLTPRATAERAAGVCQGVRARVLDNRLLLPVPVFVAWREHPAPYDIS